MKKYIGTKPIEARPMAKGEYEDIYGDSRAPGVSYDAKGYLVKCSDGVAYWSLEKQFEEAYRECDNMTFGLAIEALKKGKAVARKGWNGKGMCLFLMKGTELQSTLKMCYGEYEGEPTLTSSIAMKTAQNTIVIGWLASQTDMLSEDWHIVE